MMSTLNLNPYAAPATAQPIAEAFVPEVDGLAALDLKELRGLRSHSHTLSALGLLTMLGVAGSALMLFDPSHRVPAWACAVSFALFSVASYGYKKRPTWGRFTGLIHSTMMLFAFPIGSLIGGLGLATLSKSSSLFGDEAPTPTKIDLEWKRRQLEKKQERKRRKRK